MLELSESLTIIPLEAQVLFPSVVLKAPLKGQEASLLYKKYTELGNKLYLAAVPIVASQKHSFEDRIFDYGCTAKVLRVQKEGPSAFVFHIEGISRFKTLKVEKNDTYVATVHHIHDPMLSNKDQDIVNFKALIQSFLDRIGSLQIPEGSLDKFSQLLESTPLSSIADFIITVVQVSFDEKLTMLSTLNVKRRIELATGWIERQLNMIQISKQIHSSMVSKVPQDRNEFYLRQQLQEIQKELDGSTEDAEDDDSVMLEKKFRKVGLPESVQKLVQREMRQLKKLQPASGEYAVLQNYLEQVADLPWNTSTTDEIDIQKARRELDGDSFGLDHVKKRIIEYLSVIKVNGDLKAPILCFVGPPGVGKTSLGKSIANSLNRKFHRVALGGVRDEADIRGHRRTYVGSMPGLIIQALQKCRVNNPMILLDEIDKLSQSNQHGNPAAALLEVLDPEQNCLFSDHYLNLPFDLSRVLFIATANSLDSIPEPLLDRMEIITLNGYTFDDKLFIAKSHLLPKQIRLHGLAPDAVSISDDTLVMVAEDYTRESGVRSLERSLSSIVRAKCVEWAAPVHSYNPKVSKSDVRAFLGAALYDKEVVERDSMPGVVTGLAYSGSGNGGILFIEASQTPGHGQLTLTGSLGDVIKESAVLALTWVKANAFSLNLIPNSKINLLKNSDVHIHVPNGSTPKDGPSAGVTMVTSLVSLFSGYHVPSTTAMTGEISLRGQVLPVGGIREKVVSAHRAGILKIILPYRNRKDVDQDVPKKLQNDIEFVYAKSIWDVLQAAVNKPEKWNSRSIESRL